MSTQPALTVSQQITFLKEQLLTALCQKVDAEAALEKAQENVVAIRNALTGIQIAQQATPEHTPTASKVPA